MNRFQFKNHMLDFLNDIGLSEWRLVSQDKFKLIIERYSSFSSNTRLIQANYIKPYVFLQFVNSDNQLIPNTLLNNFMFDINTLPDTRFKISFNNWLGDYQDLKGFEPLDNYPQYQRISREYLNKLKQPLLNFGLLKGLITGNTNNNVQFLIDETSNTVVLQFKDIPINEVLDRVSKI